ncbi:hypothetical protein YPPY66_2265, partial [Yersinia pestis PY-66]
MRLSFHHHRSNGYARYSPGYKAPDGGSSRPKRHCVSGAAIGYLLLRVEGT